MLAMGKIRALLIVCSLLIILVETHPKNLCIIGAGRAGLAVIKAVAEQTNKFKPIVYERNSDVGGLWMYTDKTGLDKHGLPIHSAVYKNLRAITSKDQMTYPDFRTFNINDNDAYVSHETFLEYMRNYTDHFGLREYIEFNTMVTRVKPLNAECHRSSSGWQIESRNLDTNESKEIVCDGVIICSGRFHTPNVPKLPGIESFSGKVLHSHAYRIPEDFVNKKVLVWGAGPSGLGITRDLSTHAKHIFLSRKPTFMDVPDDLLNNVSVVRNLVKFDGHDFVLEDNTKINADVLIYCTGYVYNFPFLDESSGIVPDRQKLYPLVRNFINKEHPSMAFIGLNDFDVTGDIMYFEDDSKINADVFIYCTGYEYNFPNLDENSGIVPDRQKLYPLVRNIINKEHPSMAFIGLTDADMMSGDVIYYESKYFLSTLEDENK